MKYTTLNENGLPTAFYSDELHLDIPKEAIEITEDQWLECINNNGARQFINGELIEYVYIPTNLEIIAQKVLEAKRYLSLTDFKMLPDYEPKEGEDMEVIRVKRAEAREFVRGNK